MPKKSYKEIRESMVIPVSDLTELGWIEESVHKPATNCDVIVRFYDFENEGQFDAIGYYEDGEWHAIGVAEINSEKATPMFWYPYPSSR